MLEALSQPWGNMPTILNGRKKEEVEYLTSPATAA
jgi:hypothetical protein